MIQKDFSFGLYEGSRKWKCPQCGQKTFVCYVDSNGEVIDETCGRCDREDKCSYHLPPREFFESNGIVPKVCNKPTYKQEPKPSYMEPQVLEATMCQYEKNDLVNFLCNHFPQESVMELVFRYFVGTANKWDGSAVFWYIDKHNHIRGGKIMKYDRRTGKRVKEPFNHVTWAQKELGLTDYNFKMCLFGEHLLHDHYNGSDEPVIVVESEKTALILMLALQKAVLASQLVVACGGCGGISAKMLEPLYGHDVLFIPDEGVYDKWSSRVNALSDKFKGATVSDIMERVAKQQGDDIGDYIIEHIQYLDHLLTNTIYPHLKQII